MRLLVSIALRHLLFRKRQSLVSLMGIILGVAFFLAVASLMQGSEKDFIKRLVDNSPHITISDEFRNPRRQPAQEKYPDALVELRSLKPQEENRGIRGYERILSSLKREPGVEAAAALTDQVIVRYAGQNKNITLNGIIPAEMVKVSTIPDYMKSGTLNDLEINPDGIIIGQQLARNMMLGMGDNLTVASASGSLKTLKVIGIFRTGRSSYDERQAYVQLKRMQALTDRANRINTIIIRMRDAWKAHDLATDIESRIGYKSVSWQEASEDIMNTLKIRNTIMYSVVSAIMIVASFGIYNVISTVVMEKHRDIAILKSMGFHGSDVQWIFVIQGILLGIFGSLLGLMLGCGIMLFLMQIHIKPPGSTEAIQMPLFWGWPQFALAAVFAMFSSVMAALLPARKASAVQPVDILRGSV